MGCVRAAGGGGCSHPRRAPPRVRPGTHRRPARRSPRARVFAPEESAERVGDASQGGHAEALAVQDALARLPEEQCEAVALVLIEGFSYKEAAHIMEVPIGTLTSRLARGREALQEMLDESGRTRR